MSYRQLTQEDRYQMQALHALGSSQLDIASRFGRELGHWERDCVLGQRGASALLTIIDRKSRYPRIRHARKVDTTHVGRATEDALAKHRRVTKTITNDNGVEFQRDEALQTRLQVPICFTDPAHPGNERRRSTFALERSSASERRTRYSIGYGSC